MGKKSALTKLEEIIERFGLRTTFPDAVTKEVEQIERSPGWDDPDLVDLLHLPFVTIDNEDSRDLDQAIHVERAGSEDIVRYALADASYYVKPGTELFAEALRRGSSYYLPERSIPMLPRALSEGIVSLNEDQIRRALVVEMTLDEAGEVVKTEFIRALVKSRQKLSYDGVQAYHDGTKAELGGQPFTETLDLLRVVGEKRIARAKARGVVQFNRTSLEIDFADPKKKAHLRAVSDLRNDVEKWNEQISLMCNIEGAKLLKKGMSDPEVQPIFRVHPGPPPERLQNLAQTLSQLVRTHQLDPEVWRWQKNQNLGDYLAQLPEGGPTERIARAVNHQALFTNVRSTFAKEPGRHFGIGAGEYARFSSPMREIVGIFTHKEAFEQLHGPTGQTAERDLELQDEVVKAGDRSKSLQKKLMRECYGLVIDQILEADLDLPQEERPERTGTVMGLSANRIYVELDDPAVQLKVYLRDVERIAKLRFSLDGAVLKQTKKEKFELRTGDAIQLVLHSYLKDKRRWRLIPSAIN